MKGKSNKVSRGGKASGVAKATSRAIALPLADRVIELIESARQKVAVAANLAMVYTYFEIGRQIVEEEQGGAKRAGYGQQLLEELGRKLTARFGRGWGAENLKLMRRFYQVYSDSVNTVYQIQNGAEKVGANSSNSVREIRTGNSADDVCQIPNFTLSWSHYLKLMRIEDAKERAFYEIEASNNHWSLRELQRQFDSSLYERLALSRNKKKILELSRKGHVIAKPEDALKDPLVLEFTGIPERAEYSEDDLEQQLIDHIQEFMLELGKGFAFVGRQKRISFDERHFRVDLVFFNRILKCFVLIDLKRGDLKHQDLGQMAMYVNYFDRYEKLPDENPTIGIVLCHDKSDALVELTLPKDNNQIFAKKYRTVLPSKQKLKQLVEAHLK